MNILYLNTHEEANTLGGSSLSLYNMLRALPADYHSTVVVQSQGAVYDFFASRGIEVWAIPSQVCYCGDGYGLKYYLTWLIRWVRDGYKRQRFIRQIMKKIGDRKIELIHSNSATIDVGNLLAQRLHVPHVWHLREFVGPNAPFKPFLPFSHLKRNLRKADATICITHAIAQHYEVNKWPNNLTLFDAVGKEEDLCVYGEREQFFVFCGGENKVKRPEWAIRAFCLFYQRHPDYLLHILGYQDSRYHDELLAMIPEEVKPSIFFDGYVTDVSQYLRRATGLLMCTEFEALGRVTIEAQMKSCPVIGAASGGTLELIEDHKTGLLFHTIEECAACMDLLVSRPETAKEISRSALGFARTNFLEEEYGYHISQLYQRLIRQRQTEKARQWSQSS